MNLTEYIGKRIALLMDVQGREAILRGTTRLLRNNRQEHTLEVTVFGDNDSVVGRPVFYITEQVWRRQIANGTAFECDYCLDLSSNTVEAA